MHFAPLISCRFWKEPFHTLCFVAMNGGKKHYLNPSILPLMQGRFQMNTILTDPVAARCSVYLREVLDPCHNASQNSLPLLFSPRFSGQPLFCPSQKTLKLAASLLAARSSRQTARIHLVEQRSPENEGNLGAVICV